MTFGRLLLRAIVGWATRRKMNRTLARDMTHITIPLYAILINTFNSLFTSARTKPFWNNLLNEKRYIAFLPTDCIETILTVVFLYVCCRHVNPEPRAVCQSSTTTQRSVHGQVLEKPFGPNQLASHETSFLSACPFSGVLLSHDGIHHVTGCLGHYQASPQTMMLGPVGSNEMKVNIFFGE